MNLESLLPQVSALAGRACAEILEVYQRDDFGIEQKSDESPLTQADLASHRCIVAGLPELSDIPILSEESAAMDFSERKCWRRYWLVDPLDGTKEFIKRNGEFTVNIALIDGGRPVLGVVSVPVTDRHYFAAEGVGAFVRQGEGPTSSIAVRDLSDDHPLAVVGSRSHPSPQLQGYLDRLGSHETVAMGSSLKFCLIAEGKADLYPRLGPTSEWDTAAAQCVVEQAGGMVTDLQLRPLEYNTKESLLNPHFLVFGDPNRNWAAELVAD